MMIRKLGVTSKWIPYILRIPKGSINVSLNAKYPSIFRYNLLYLEAILELPDLPDLPDFD